MRLARHRQLDALIGEYMLGTLRGGARRRFERALREEPAVALRLRTLQQEFTPRYSERIAATPAAGGWQRLARELNLSQHRAPWYSRASFLRGWVLGATAAVVLGVMWVTLRTTTEPTLTPIAQLAAKGAPPSVTARLSRDGSTLELRAARSNRCGAGAELPAMGHSARRRAAVASGARPGRWGAACARRAQRAATQGCGAGDLGRAPRGFTDGWADRTGDSFGRNFINKANASLPWCDVPARLWLDRGRDCASHARFLAPGSRRRCGVHTERFAALAKHSR